MAPVRPFALFQTRDQWLRAAHDRTAIDAETGGVQLALAAMATAASTSDAPGPAAGLAFDSGCRLYHSLPVEGCVERVLWAAHDPLGVAADQPEPIDLFSTMGPVDRGEFQQPGPIRGPVRRPGALAIDDEDRLFVAETGARRVLVFDLPLRRLVRRVAISVPGTAGATPIDVAADGRTVWVLTRPFGILRMAARSGPVPVEVRENPKARLPIGHEAVRLAVAPDGRFALLGHDPAGGSFVAWLRGDEHLDDTGRPRRHLTVVRVQPIPQATDLEFQARRILVVALRPGEDLLSFRDDLADEPLKAKGYDGQGIVRTPDGRIAFWTDHGVRHAVGARVRYVDRGRVTAYALDGRDYQMSWGRLFLDACVPHGTEIRVHFATSDDLPETEPTLTWTPADNARDLRPLAPERTPPLIPVSLAPTSDDRGKPIHRRSDGRELPWVATPADDPFVTFDVPVQAAPGRYLWMTLDLRGDGRATPRIRSLRVERPGHDLMRRLPRIYSRDEPAEAFLRRYLAMVDGVITSLEDRSADRRALIDPASTPAELLPWLAAFVGLVLDERWPVRRRRALIGEAVSLFRMRGTVGGLLRFLELCLGTRPIIVEQFRVRGLGGAVLRDATGPVASSPVLGAGFRVGGSVGEVATQVSTTTTTDAFATNAHRFALILPVDLSADELAATTDLIEVHRPAHTIVEVCPVGVGMRVGNGLHVGLSSVIGRSSGWDQIQLGASALGTTGLLGRPSPGFGPGTARLERDTRLS